MKKTLIAATIINWLCTALLIAWVISYYPTWKAQKEAEGERATLRKLDFDLKKADAIAQIEAKYREIKPPALPMDTWKADSLNYEIEKMRIKALINTAKINAKAGGGTIEVLLK